MIRNDAKKSIFEGKADHEVTTEALLEYQKTRKAKSKPSDKTQKKNLGKGSFGLLWKCYKKEIVIDPI